MAESIHNKDRSARVENCVTCYLCSRRFLDPRLLSCHHTICRACLRCHVTNGNVICPKCGAALKLSADGLKGLPSSPRIIDLLKLVNAQKSMDSLAIRERHARSRTLQYRTPAIAIVTPYSSDYNKDERVRVEEFVKCAVCSRRFEDPRLLSCHHTFCKACLGLYVNATNHSVRCPKCGAALNLSADGLEGLPSSPKIIDLLKLVNAQKSMDSLAIRGRHARGRNPQHVAPDIAMVTPPRTDSDDGHGDIAVVTPYMPGYAERRGTVFIASDALLGATPGCIAVSPAADRLYVTIYGQHTVLIFDDLGKLIITAYGPDVSPGASPRGGKLGFERPTGIAVNKDGDVIVSDTYNHRVVVLDRDGEYKFSFGTPGKNDGQFDRQRGVAVDDACTIYVCDWGNDRIQVFTRDGTHLRTFEIPGNVSGLTPQYLAIAPRTTGRVYVTYWLNPRVGQPRVFVYTPLGRWITCFGTEGHGEGDMYMQAGICVDDDGRVLIADSGNHRVQVFNVDGTYHCTLGAAHDTPPLSASTDLTIDKNGRVFVVDTGNKRVLVF